MFMKEFFKKLKFKDYLLIILALLALLFYFQYKHYYKESLTPVIVHDNDSLYEYKNKLNEVYKEKDIYVQNLKDVKNQNTLLAAEVKKLKDNPIVVTQTKIKVKVDTVKAVSDTVYLSDNFAQDSTYNLKWHIDEPNNYYKVDGFTFVKSDFSTFMTQLNNLELNTNITLNIIEQKKQLKFIARSDNPYVNITNMDGIVFDPSKSKTLKQYFKQDKIVFGPTLGVGLDKNFKFTPFLGVAVMYRLFGF